MRALFLGAALLLPAAVSGAAGLREVEPLLGRWEGTLKCSSDAERVRLEFTKVKGGVSVAYSSSKSESKASLVPQEGEGRFRVTARVGGIAALRALKLETVPGSLTVSDDEEDEDSPGRDYLTFSAGVGKVIKYLGSAKLRDGYKTLSYQVKIESPLYQDLCSGILKKAKGRKA